MGRHQKSITLKQYMEDKRRTEDRPWQELRDEAVAERRAKVQGKTANHNRYLKSIETNVVTVCLGPAGTGKSYMAVAKAVELFQAGRVEKIVLTRPLVGCDEDTGFLPGDLGEKIAPFMRPMLDYLNEFLGAEAARQLLARKQVEAIPLAFMQGMTFRNAFVLLDEAQNTTEAQLRMFMTRFGLNAKVVINGCFAQNTRGGHALEEVVRKFETRLARETKPMGIVRMSRNDILRHPFIQWIDETFDGDGPGAAEWVSISCPACQKKLWYDAVATDDVLVECCSCQQAIEVYDANGTFDPEIVTPFAVDVPSPSFPEKP
jgi:phosphate starvation-inducible PhoH-like protein